MHHTRRTHNAHNETQRRLAKLAFKTKGIDNNPKYYRYHYMYGGSISYIDTYFDKYFSYCVSSRTHGATKYFRDSLEDIHKYKDHSFYKRVHKSSGPKSRWKQYKKQLHRRWRRRNIDSLTFTYKDAVGCSFWRDLMW